MLGEGSWGNTCLPSHQTQNPNSSEKYTVLCGFKSHCSREGKLEKSVLQWSELLMVSASGTKMHSVLPRAGEQGCHHQLPMQSFTAVLFVLFFLAWRSAKPQMPSLSWFGYAHSRLHLPLLPPSPHLLSCASAETDVLSQGQVLCLRELRVRVSCLGSLKEMEIPSHKGHKHSPLCGVPGHYQCFIMQPLTFVMCFVRSEMWNPECCFINFLS